jgi:hypothetical protein
VRNDYLDKVKLEKDLIENNEGLFIYDWANKDKVKKFLIKVLPSNIIYILKVLKKYLIRLTKFFS